MKKFPVGRAIIGPSKQSVSLPCQMAATAKKHRRFATDEMRVCHSQLFVKHRDAQMQNAGYRMSHRTRHHIATTAIVRFDFRTSINAHNFSRTIQPHFVKSRVNGTTNSGSGCFQSGHRQQKGEVVFGAILDHVQSHGSLLGRINTRCRLSLIIQWIRSDNTLTVANAFDALSYKRAGCFYGLRKSTKIPCSIAGTVPVRYIPTTCVIETELTPTNRGISEICKTTKFAASKCRYPQKMVAWWR